MALGVHPEVTALDSAAFGIIRRCVAFDGPPPKDGPYSLHEIALRKRLPNKIIGAHFEPEQLVDFAFLRGKENYRQVRPLTYPAQQFDTVHARHLDIENSKIRRTGFKALQRGRAVSVSQDVIAF